MAHPSQGEAMTREQYKRYKLHLRSMTDGELDNEAYTLREERQYLNHLTDEVVAERLSLCQYEMTRRVSDSF